MLPQRLSAVAGRVVQPRIQRAVIASIQAVHQHRAITGLATGNRDLIAVRPPAKPQTRCSTTAATNTKIQSFQDTVAILDHDLTTDFITPSALPDTLEEITIEDLFEKAILPWERRHVGEWLIMRFQLPKKGANTMLVDGWIHRFWCYGCTKQLLHLESLWERVPKVIQEDIRAKTAYMCARLWSGDCATAEEFLYTEFFQTDLSSFTPEKRVEYANMSQQLIRALSWEYADQYNFKATARIELRRQYWIQRYSHLDGLGSWDNNEPTIVMLHYYCSLFRHMLTKTVLSKREFQNNEMRFNQLLEDTRRNAKFQRELEFYNIFLRCQNALSQLRERLGIFPDYLNADKILREMKSDGVTPNRFTYHLLMEGIVYSQIPFPENFDRAMSIAQRMDVAGVDQRVSRTYELLIRTFPLSNHAYQHSSNFIKHNSSPLLNTSTTTTNANDSSLPTRAQGMARLLSIESLMLGHHEFAHTTATMCSFWYRLAALGRFKDVQERWEQLSSAGVQFERIHYDTFLRVACRHPMSASYALTVIFHQMQREVPSIPLDSGLLLGYLNCCVRVGDRHKAIQMLEAMQRRISPIDGVSRIRPPIVDDPLQMADPSMSRDWNNCLRPLIYLCKRFESELSIKKTAGIKQHNTALSRRLRSASYNTDDQMDRLRELTKQVILPPISPRASPYPRVRYYIDVEQNLDAAEATIIQHIQAYESDVSNSIDMLSYAVDNNSLNENDSLNGFNDEDKPRPNTNPAYFVQVSRSYEKLARSYMEIGDLGSAKQTLIDVIKHYLNCAPGLVHLAQGKRRGRPLILPDWTLLGDFALKASDPTVTEEETARKGEKYARWALAEALPEFEKAAKLRGDLNLPDLPWITEVESRLGQRAARMNSITK